MSEDGLKPRYCLSCDYDLRASSDCCPECGRRFDPADVRSFSVDPKRSRLRRWILGIVLPVFVIMVLLTVSIAMLWYGWNSEQRAIQSMQPYVYVNKTRSILPSPMIRLLGNRFAYLAQRSDEITVQSRGIANANLTPIEELTHLHKVIFWNGTVHREDIAHFAKLPDLRTLQIFSANVSDDSLAALSDFPELEEFESGFDNGLTESCLEAIAKSPNLRILRLRNIVITKAVPLKQLLYLSELELSGYDIDDRAMEAISGLPQLKILRLRGTGISRAGLAKLRSLTQLQSLTLEPFIDARWSTELKLLPALKQLDLIYRSQPTAFEENWMRSELPGVHISFRLNESGLTFSGGILPDLVPSSQPSPPN